MIENKRLWRIIKRNGQINLAELNEILLKNGYQSVVGLPIGSVEVILLATEEQIQHLKETNKIEVYAEYLPDGQVNSYLMRLNTLLLIELISSIEKIING